VPIAGAEAMRGVRGVGGGEASEKVECVWHCFRPIMPFTRPAVLLDGETCLCCHTPSRQICGGQ
jgi:hypothetical protein